MKKTTLNIKGMHCQSCEILIGDELSQIKNVEDVRVDAQKGIAVVSHSKHVSYAKLANAVKKAGYDIGKDIPKPLFSRNLSDYLEVIVIGLVLAVGYLIASDMGLFKVLEVSSNNLASLPVVFMIGLTAGISTCAALVGGLVLGISSKFAKMNLLASSSAKFLPHLYFNLGRIIAFFIFGGVIGIIGSIFQMSLGFMGLMTIVIGVAMLIFGAQLTDLFPRLSGFNITIPSGIAKLIGLKEQTDKEYSHKNAMILGGITFFLPCGFTQLVQLFAISTANPITASLTMGIFALGTTPGLLGIGGLTSIIKGNAAKPFFKFAGLVVIALAIFNISNGLTLSGLKTALVSGGSGIEDVAGAYVPDGDVQVLQATYTDRDDLRPNKFKVTADKPVRFEIDVQDDGFGCMGSMALPGLSKQIEMLKKGEPMIFEFTPKKSGTYSIACAMGVPRGSITVL